MILALKNGSIEKTGNKVHLFVASVARQIVRKLMTEVRNPGLGRFFLNSVENVYAIGDRWKVKIGTGRFDEQYLK